MAVKMASGEAFELHGDLDIKVGGDILLSTETGSDDNNRAIIQWNLNACNVKLGGDYDNKSIVFYPSSDDTARLDIGDDWGLGGSHRFHTISIKAGSELKLSTYTAGALYGAMLSLDKTVTSDRNALYVHAQSSASYKAGFYCYTDESDTEAYIQMFGDLRIADDNYIGLGDSAGRIVFDDQATDEINFLSCVVGIGTSTPSANADLTLEGGAICLKETTTPTADTNYGKVYTKNDNKLYFQDGAGSEHEIAFA